jgi:hypothetical protein
MTTLLMQSKRYGAMALQLLLLLAVPAAVEAQEQGAAEREAVKQLLKRVEQLEARIKELESKQTPAVSQAASEEKPAESSREETPQISDPHSASHEKTRFGSPMLQLRGFADVNYRVSNLKGETNTFAMGQLDLFITSRLSDRFSVLSELVLEASEENELLVDVERLLLQYTHNDYFKLAAGRYHTALGYYNTAFHHGTWFQTAVGRPFIFEFEDDEGILPIHNVGLTATGRVPSGKLGLHYVAEIGNGRAHKTPESEPVQIVVDENNGKAFNLGAYARPDWLPGFQAGFNVYRDRLTPEGSPNIDETILAAHVVYQDSAWEFLNEALLVRHSILGGGRTFNTPGAYTQISRRFGKTSPYFRYQYVNTAESNPILGEVGRRNGPSFGCRFDMSEFAAFKVQYDRTARRRLESIDALTLQMAFTF